MSRKFDYGKVITTLEKYTRLFPKPLPPIEAMVMPGKRRLKTDRILTGEGHLYLVGMTITSLFRDERIELAKRRALVCRPYAERLIQMAIAYGDRHKPTMEVCDYFIADKELIHKLFEVYVPRYRNCKSSFTALHRLPDVYSPTTYRLTKMSILEMKGNPYPPVVEEEKHDKSLLNVLLRAYSKRREEAAGKPISGDNGTRSPPFTSGTTSTTIIT